MALRDAGAEVIYLGLRVPVADIVAAAVAEDATVIGISVLSGAHLPLAEHLLTAIRAAGLETPLAIAGGSPPPAAPRTRPPRGGRVARACSRWAPHSRAWWRAS